MTPIESPKPEPCSAAPRPPTGGDPAPTAHAHNELAQKAPVRLIGAGAEQLIREFEASPLLAEGRLTLVALDAIAERLEEKWPGRRSRVYEHCQRILRREFAADTLIQLISETEYLVAHASTPGAAGRLRCINCLRETLHYFLGEATDDAIRVSVVTQISKDGIHVERVSPAQAEAAAKIEARQSAPRDRDPAQAPDWTPFRSSAGADLQISCELAPLLRLNGLIEVGYRLAPLLARGQDFETEAATLPPSESEKLHNIALSLGLDRLQALGESHRPMTVVVPVALSALKSCSARPSVVALLRRARSLVRHGVLCEFTGLEAATHWALQDAAACVKPFCLHTLARLPSLVSIPLESLQRSGVSAYAMRCPSIEDDESFVCWLLKTRQISSCRPKAVILDGVASAARAQMALEFGFTHATLALPEPAAAEDAAGVARAA